MCLQERLEVSLNWYQGETSRMDISSLISVKGNLHLSAKNKEEYISETDGTSGS